MKLAKKILVENRYSGHGWNFEKTTKYIFQVDCMQLEAGYFEHYLDNKFVKAVIELPVSYGCPAHCKFCATSGLDAYQRLTAEQMQEILDYIWIEQQLSNRQFVLLSITGTGDLYYNFSNVKQFLRGLEKYSNLQVTLSSCLWTKEYLKEIEELSQVISVRNVQITFVSDSQTVQGNMIPVYSKKSVNIDEVLAYISLSSKTYYRINYIMIRNINDGDEDFQRFQSMLLGIREKIIVRIAKLNETAASRTNGLQPPEKERMECLEKMLLDSGVRAYLFYAYENDHMNCGQLITEQGI